MGWVKTEKTNKLSKLGDIDFTTTAPVDGNALVYDETNDIWVPGEGGGSANEALPYDATASYSYGDYCIQDNYLWRCISTTTVTGTWDATKWIAVLVTNEYKRVRIMNKAAFDLLSADEKDGFIYVSDYPTKIQDIDNVNLTTSDNNKLLGVSVSGSDISVSAVDIDTSLDTTSHNPIENMAVALGLNKKMDSSRIVSTSNGTFPGLVANESVVYLIACMQISVQASIVLLIHKYKKNVFVKEIVKDSNFSYVTNELGTVSITYSGSSMGVSGGAIKLNYEP